MNICILGIGGVGGYIGGRLAQNAEQESNQVSFIARGPHLQAVKNSGLTIKTDDEEFTVVPHLATDSPGEVGVVDLLVIGVKAYDLPGIIDDISRLVSVNTIILPLLNGINHVKELEQRFPSNLVVDACIYIASNIESPGVIRSRNRLCKIIMGKGEENLERLRPVQQVFCASQIDTELVADPLEAIWTKYLFISALACTTSLYGESIGRILEDNTKKALFNGLVKEGVSVARKAGISLPPDIVEQIVDRAQQAGYESKTSMQRDFEQGKRTELDALCGALVRQGAEVKTSIPLYEKVYAILKRWQA
ncbi:MAG: ketopantoate reductase family protein [Syntrophomonadaceae bacterium]|jgi:2-dehydropantoate 2-reductase